MQTKPDKAYCLNNLSLNAMRQEWMKKAQAMARGREKQQRSQGKGRKKWDRNPPRTDIY